MSKLIFGIGFGVCVSVLAPAGMMAGNLSADQADYYNWCRSQGGTPYGIGTDMGCTPPSGGAAAAGGGGGGVNAQMDAQMMQLANQAGMAIGKWLFSPSSSPEEEAQKQQARQREMERLRQEQLEAQAKQREFDASKAQLLRMLEGGSSGAPGMAASDGLQLMDLSSDGLENYHKTNEMRRKSLSKLKNKKDEAWCKLHFPYKPSKPEVDVAGQYPAALARYNAQKRSWEDRCGGSPLDGDDQAPGGAGDANAQAPAPVRTLAPQVANPTPPAAEQSGGGGLKLMDLSQDDGSSVRAPTGRGREVNAQTGEDVRGVGSSGFDDRGSVMKKAEEGNAPAPEAQGKPVNEDLKDSQSQGHYDAQKAGVQKAQNEDMKYLFPDQTKSSDPEWVKPDTFHPATQLSQNQDMRYLFPAEPAGGRHWPGPTRQNPYFNPYAKQLSDEQLHDMHERLVKQLETGTSPSAAQQGVDRAFRGEMDSDYVDSHYRDPRSNAIAKGAIEKANEAEEAAKARMHQQLLNLYRNLEQRHLVDPKKPMDAQIQNNPRLRDELEDGRVPILRRYETSVINAEAELDGKLKQLPNSQ